MPPSVASPFPTLPYDTLTWTCWILLAFGMAWWRRWRGIFFGQLGVAATILMLNVRWVHAAMSRPGWKGSPRFDAVLFVALVLHVIVVNGLLIPANLVGLFLGTRKKTSRVDGHP